MRILLFEFAPRHPPPGVIGHFADWWKEELADPEVVPVDVFEVGEEGPIGGEQHPRAQWMWRIRHQLEEAYAGLKSQLPWK